MTGYGWLNDRMWMWVQYYGTEWQKFRFLMVNTFPLISKTSWSSISFFSTSVSSPNISSEIPSNPTCRLRQDSILKNIIWLLLLVKILFCYKTLSRALNHVILNPHIFNLKPQNYIYTGEYSFLSIISIYLSYIYKNLYESL